MCKIKPKKFYEKIYAFMDATPLITNCGRLCGCLCCSDTDVGEGMYLYPGEEVMFGDDTPFAEIYDSDFISNGKNVAFLTCKGFCERERRPLACRIFPLVPYIDKAGNMKVIYDPRGVEFCPLEHRKITRKFKRQVYRISNLLFKNKEVRHFLIAQSRLIDDFMEMKFN